MTVERSERGVLTTNATLLQTDYQYNIWGLLPNSWTQEDNYTISYRGSTQLNLNDDSYVYFNYGEFAPSTSPDYELEWALVIYNKLDSNSVISESSWYDVNTKINITSQSLYDDDYFRYKIYLRRKLDENGDRPQLSRSSMNGAGVTFYGNLFYNEEQQTLPADWFVNTTVTFETDVTTMTTVVPDICNIDDDDFNAFIDIPNKIVAGINLCIVGIGSFLNLKYVTFVICFVLIVGLIAWLIH